MKHDVCWTLDENSDLIKVQFSFNMKKLSNVNKRFCLVKHFKLRHFKQLTLHNWLILNKKPFKDQINGSWNELWKTWNSYTGSCSSSSQTTATNPPQKQSRFGSHHISHRKHFAWIFTPRTEPLALNVFCPGPLGTSPPPATAPHRCLLPVLRSPQLPPWGPNPTETGATLRTEATRFLLCSPV